MNWHYIAPVKIKFGKGTLATLTDEVKLLGKKSGILITSPSFVKRGLAQSIKDSSDGLIKAVFSGVSPNPEVTEVDDCVRLIKENNCDFAVALGGGSVLDLAKAACTMCKADLPATAYLDDMSLLPAEHITLIALPTTAGTASEVTSVSVLSDHVKGVKKPLFCDGFFPYMAIIDPELTYTVPANITANTGMDVLCHAIEAYWSKHHQPICDVLATRAIKLVLENLKTVYNEPLNEQARENMAEASVLAGLAFTIPKTTSSHACSYPLTNMLKIPHGEACALTIDYFFKINAQNDTEGRLSHLAGNLGYENTNALIAAISALKDDIGIMKDLKSFNLTDAQYEALVKESQHPNLLNNPTVITEDMLREMYTIMR